MAALRFEQAVYGSFPFWSRGYALLASSPGCRPSWLAEFQAVCQRFGEPPAGAAPHASILSFPLEDGSRAVVGAFPQGQDDRGRPGALAFHGLFLTRSEFARIHENPFRVTAALRSVWQPETTLETGELEAVPDDPVEPRLDDDGQRIVRALCRGERVAVLSETPIEPLVRQVWDNLPRRARQRLSFATMAYASTIGVSLAAFPRLAEPSGYRRLEDLAKPPPNRRSMPQRLRDGLGATARFAARTVWPWSRSDGKRPAPLWKRFLPLALVMVLILGGLLLRPRPGEALRSDPAAGRPGPPIPASVEAPSGEEMPPSRRDSVAVDPDERDRVLEALQDVTARLGVAIADGDDAPALMVRFAAAMRYPGPWLSSEDRRRLEAIGTPAAARALRLDEHLRRFSADRRLPEDFAQGPLSWQLRVLAWSFRVTPHPGLTPEEIPTAIADELAPREPVEFGPLVEEFPALKSYADFLSRLRGR